MRDQEKDVLLLQIFAEEDGTGEDTGVPADAGRDNEDREANETGDRFEQLIRGEYAGEFARRTQKIIDRRFREFRSLEEKNRDYRELEKGLLALIGAESAASGEILDRLRAMVRRAPDESEIGRQCEQARSVYPDFEYSKEAKDPRFTGYLQSGLTVSEAYALIHREQLLGAAARRGALEAVKSIGSMGSRPPQMGAGPGGRDARRSVDSLSSAEIRSIVDRASRGEKVDLSDLGPG